jgi:bifunctional ADP-heptose synthase (sugar kinase/adenylyltransferase)
MKKILIIGDSCRDVFVYCHAQRLAPDLPIPILDVIEQTENPGMAANVECNIKAIYPHASLATNEGWQQVTKTRYVHKKTNHTFIRIDSKHPVLRADLRTVQFSDYDIIAISDYDKGFLTEEDIEYICTHHPLVFIDTKKILGDWVADATFIKINDFEYERSKEVISPEIADKIIRVLSRHAVSGYRESRGEGYNWRRRQLLCGAPGAVCGDGRYPRINYIRERSCGTYRFAARRYGYRKVGTLWE